MPLDPQVQAMMEQVAALGFPPAHTVSPEQARANGRARPRARGPEVARVEDRKIPGPASQLPVRIYTPEGTGPFPSLVWFHGGGWVVGDLDTADATARYLAVGSNCVVVSVDYRLAPETKFPGPVEDCYHATRWAMQNCASINAEPGKLAVGGDSAGGNLAAGVCLMSRDRGGPAPVFQLLVYPVTDRNFATESYRSNAEGYQLSRDGMVWYWDHYLQSDADASHPYAAPLQARDLSELPPAIVITAEFDPLRDEGEAYARRLETAGVSTTCTRYDGMIHGFFGMAAAVDQGKQAVDQATSMLRAAFSSPVHR
jgi:acetyl esterase